MKIDAHQHFWKFDPVRDSWIDESMLAIRRDFLPGDLAPILRENGFDGCVVVQSDQSEEENEFQLANAAQHDFIRGVVGWVDLQSPNLEDRLEYYRSFPKMKGFRHVLQGEKDRALMLQPAFKRGISLLNAFNFTYDLLVFPDQLAYCTALVRAFPDQLFVLDHIAKPYIKKGEITDWKRNLQRLAAQENVYCKVSGIVTEADWQNWTEAGIQPYLDVVFEAFDSYRVLFGSDWPVCEVAGGYHRVINLVQNYTSQLSVGEQARFWGENASRFYGL